MIVLAVMNKRFDPSQVESSIYSMWESNKLFEAHPTSSKEPFSIILPPPNANGDLHVGHAMFVYEDIMIRYKKLSGFVTLWLPGVDHAGLETQFVFEKHLKKTGKSRFDFDRKTLFRSIFEFVEQNRGTIEQQLRRLGFALDWRHEKYTMDPDIISIVNNTFKKLFDKGLVYRKEKLVNYCINCGTSYSDLEVEYEEQKDPLYFMKYGPFTLATVRPETKFGDTAVAVNPKDKRYAGFVGKTIEVDGFEDKFSLTVIADEFVDMKFGTGVVKITPAHDFNDYDVAMRHDLKLNQVIDFNGRLNKKAGKYEGMTVNKARAAVVEELKEKGLLVKVDENYSHRVGKCYKCKRVLEPLPKEQWFIDVSGLKERAKSAVELGDVAVYPKRYKKRLIEILDNFIDWNVSRQIVWGIQIPAYYCIDKHEWFVSTDKPNMCAICKNCDFKQDEDTFDTWFSSAQWPFATLKTIGDNYATKFYPTSVMETGYDIARAWVSRMLMIGLFATDKVPFKTVFLHGMVRDGKGAKMSKSKGNVVNPLVLVDQYGADALRAALIFGVQEGGDVALSEDKVRAMRNFGNKLWNIGRLIEMYKESPVSIEKKNNKYEKTLSDLNGEFNQVKKQFVKDMDTFKFSKSFDALYEFVWHRLADYYLEELKEGIRDGDLYVIDKIRALYLECLILIHPFMPFVTEAIWQEISGKKTSILTQQIN